MDMDYVSQENKVHTASGWVWDAQKTPTCRIIMILLLTFQVLCTTNAEISGKEEEKEVDLGGLPLLFFALKYVSV